MSSENRRQKMISTVVGLQSSFSQSHSALLCWKQRVAWWQSSTRTFRHFLLEGSWLSAHQISNVYEITSWHLIKASFCTPIGVCRSETWKFSTSMSDAPNVASTFTFSYMLNWTFLSVVESRHRRKFSLSCERACCSLCSCSASAPVGMEVGMVVRHRAIKRGEFGSNPRLLGSGPFGRRSTDTGTAMLMFSMPKKI